MLHLIVLLLVCGCGVYYVCKGWWIFWESNI